ncbi:RTA1 like protein-domain-containing protein [Tricladium varicosporioides]|nr:RTA1 like protein-domain-containing protein [Hymenoscyphus varicosporioides]
MGKCIPITDKDNLWSFCPNVPAAILFAVLFALTSGAHIFQAHHYKTPFCWAIIMGALWEMISFVIRVPSIYNPTSLGLYNPWFLLFLLAPLWINAFCYMLLGRMVFQYLPDRKLYKLRAQRMALCFVVLDIVSFIIQIGGGLLVLSKNVQTKQTGLHIYTAGLALQEFFIFVFVFLVFSFQRRLKHEAGPEARRKAKKLLITMYLSLALISIRILYRLLEFASSFTSKLTQELWYHEVWQYCFDALPMFLALVLFNVIHPGTLIPGDKSKFIVPVGTELSGHEKTENSSNEAVMVERSA